MLIDTVLTDNEIVLKNIFESDCTEKYVNWLNNKEINTFLLSYWYPQTLNSVINFVKTTNESNHSLLLGIFYNNIHVGNIKLGPIEPVHSTAEIGYIIGEKEYWNKGIAAKAIKLMCSYAFYTLKIHKIYAGINEYNKASIQTVKKCGFIQEAHLRKSSIYLHKDNYVDSYLFGLLKEDLIQ